EPFEPSTTKVHNHCVEAQGSPDGGRVCAPQSGDAVLDDAVPFDGARTMPSTVLREFCEADAQEINRLAVTAFEEFGCHYSDWPALAAFYGKMSDLAKSGEIVVAEIAANIVGAVAYIPPHQRKAAYFDQAWPVIRSLVVD